MKAASFSRNTRGAAEEGNSASVDKRRSLVLRSGLTPVASLRCTLMSRPMMTMLKALLLAAMIALAAAAGPRRALLETYDDAEEDAAAELGNPDEAVEVGNFIQLLLRPPKAQ